ncbi:cAMP-dependent protein kinase subunit [Desmophyllum pertusum]|uniref:Thiamine pyrophosphokinase n=1 Tax=Desmophyllum pertusum TaxID=174260 RepID=A0A9X0A5B6_9CNID|nr:cAMP-dependent protein kinase subunit [Desmophyllum pertusum]
MATKWTPLACLSALAGDEFSPKDQKLNVALVVVNMPLDGMIDKFKALSTIASVKAYTDGGANRVSHIVGEERERYLPDYVSGDFDSIDANILNFYREKGIEVISTPDQDETDFTKCLRILISKQHIDKFDQIVVINAFGERLDQTMANIETLFHMTKLTKKPVYLMSEDSLACLLTPGKHVIRVNTGLEEDWCGLIPIGAKCTHITTTGLKWNLTDGELEFGTLVSTSNAYDGSDMVTIETDTAILWTMGVK